MARHDKFICLTVMAEDFQREPYGQGHNYPISLLAIAGAMESGPTRHHQERRVMFLMVTLVCQNTPIFTG